jgi:phosphatidylserine/phosphatidylglycerophosphate/cardiolipin synthase-like enzyme
VGNLPPLLLDLDLMQFLLVVGIALVAAFLVGLLVRRVTLRRLFGPFLWALLGIGVCVAFLPQFWNGDYIVDGLPLFTMLIGAFVTLLLFHLLRRETRRPETAAPPPVAPPVRGDERTGTSGVIPVREPAGPHGEQAITSDRGVGTAVAAPPVAAPAAAVPGVQLLFHSQRAGINAGLVEELVTFILGTRHSLDCAIYDLRHPQILQALAKVAEGKKLRIAYDAGKNRAGADPKPGGNQEAIDAAGLRPFASSVHEGTHLMHNKFLIRDGRTVWTGSANFTSGGLELQDNNCLVIDSPELAAQYEATFNDLLSPEHHHTRAKGERTMGTPVHLGEAVITPDFAPAAGEGIEDGIIAALKGVRRLRIMAFLMSDVGILGALEPLARNHQVDIQGIYDPNGMEDALRSNRQDERLFWFLHDSRFVAAPTHAFHAQGEQDFMHNKVMIINDSLVVTGSYNFSESAESNDENVLFIQSPTVAAAYNAYFDTLYNTYRANPYRGNTHQENVHGEHARRGAEGQ